jgi:hypothetical protein
MVIDEGGLGKLIANEIRRRHKLPVKRAEKTSKGAFIKLFNAALRRGEFRCKSDSVFAEEAGLVRKDFAAMAASGKLAELPVGKGGYHGNMTDVALYGWRECQAYIEQEPRAPLIGPIQPQAPDIIGRALAAQRKQARRNPLDRLLGFE